MVGGSASRKVHPAELAGCSTFTAVVKFTPIKVPFHLGSEAKIKIVDEAFAPMVNRDFHRRASGGRTTED